MTYTYCFFDMFWEDKESAFFYYKEIDMWFIPLSTIPIGYVHLLVLIALYLYYFDVYWD